jgi:hypothetical protein
MKCGEGLFSAIMVPTASIRRIQVEPQIFRSISRALSGAVSDGQATN